MAAEEEADSVVSVVDLVVALAEVVQVEAGNIQNVRYAPGKKSYTGWIILGVIVLLVVIGLAVVVGGYNSAVRRSEAVKSRWGNVDNEMQRRFDLIPNLVKTVQGYAAHETELFTHLADARTKYFQPGSTMAQKAQAAGMLQGALSRLMLLQERYPDLKANRNFEMLQVDLAGTENRIEWARKQYNIAVESLNSYQKEFFGSMFCNWAGVGPAEYFKASEIAATTVPEVEF